MHSASPDNRNELRKLIEAVNSLKETMERSIKSQDNFAESANFIGLAAIILTAAQIFIAPFILNP